MRNAKWSDGGDNGQMFFVLDDNGVMQVPPFCTREETEELALLLTSLGGVRGSATPEKKTFPLPPSITLNIFTPCVILNG